MSVNNINDLNLYMLTEVNIILTQLNYLLRNRQQISQNRMSRFRHSSKENQVQSTKMICVDYGLFTRIVNYARNRANVLRNYRFTLAREQYFQANIDDTLEEAIWYEVESMLTNVDLPHGWKSKHLIDVPNLEISPRSMAIYVDKYTIQEYIDCFQMESNRLKISSSHQTTICEHCQEHSTESNSTICTKCYENQTYFCGPPGYIYFDLPNQNMIRSYDVLGKLTGINFALMDRKIDKYGKLPSKNKKILFIENKNFKLCADLIFEIEHITKRSWRTGIPKKTLTQIIIREH